MLSDLRLAARRVLNARGFSASVVLILSVGIGFAAAMASVLNALSFKALNLSNARALVSVMSVDPQGFRRNTPLPAVDHLRRSTLPVDGWCATTSTIEATESGGRVMDAYGELMSGDCLTVLGVAPAMGRWFESSEMPLTGKGLPVIVISHRYWLRMFDGTQDVLGRTVRIQNTDTQVVGVMPEGFNGFSPEYAVDFIIPFNAHRISSGPIGIVGRLRAGASIEEVRSQVRAMWPAVLDAVVPQGPARAQLLKERSGDAESYAAGSSVLRRLYATPVRNMTILSAALIFLVCVNVGGLLLARVSARSLELAAMRALGASTYRLARPLAAEALIYAGAGALFGVPLAYTAAKAFATLLPWANLPWAIVLTPDARVLAGIVAGVVGLAVGISLLPVWLAARHARLHHTDRTVTRTSNRLGRVLLIAQVALTITLVFTSGLVIRSFTALWDNDRGYDHDGVIAIRLVPNPGGYDKFDQHPYYATLMERLGALPGVRSAGFARYFGTINTSLPPQPIAFAGGAPDSGTTGVMEYVSPKFFETVRIPLLRGRDVNWNDAPATPKVALVSESLARALDPAGNVVGRVIRYGTDPATSELQIVGVVGNISIGNLRDNTVRIVYMSGVQAGQATYATVQLRVSGDPFAVARPATDAIGAMGREHVQRIVPVNFLFSNSVVAERMATVASTVAAILALAISCAGLFALLSHSVARRTREIGIRMAVGASPAAVSKLVMRETSVLVLSGLAAGIPAAFAAASLVKALLFGVTTTDSATMLASAAMLLVTALAAAVPPTLRAVRVDPAIALRAE